MPARIFKDKRGKQTEIVAVRAVHVGALSNDTRAAYLQALASLVTRKIDAEVPCFFLPPWRGSRETGWSRAV